MTEEQTPKCWKCRDMGQTLDSCGCCSSICECRKEALDAERFQAEQHLRNDVILKELFTLLDDGDALVSYDQLPHFVKALQKKLETALTLTQRMLPRFETRHVVVPVGHLTTLESLLRSGKGGEEAKKQLLADFITTLNGYQLNHTTANYKRFEKKYSDAEMHDGLVKDAREQLIAMFKQAIGEP